MSGDMWHVRNTHEAEMFSKFVLSELEAGRVRVYKLTKGSRTLKQNGAIWAFLTRLANEFNARGVTLRAVVDVISNRIDVDWDKDVAKATIWNPIMEAITKKDSSRELEIDEVKTIVASVQRMAASNFDINVPFGAEELE